MRAPRERPGLCGVTACRWTVNWACPGSAAPGRRGYAHDDGTRAFRCCCLMPPSLLPPPPPPAPPPPVFLHAFFGCERGMLEGDRVQLVGDEEDTRWLVVKSRDVGEPAPRLCEAELQHRGTAQPQAHQRAGLARPSFGPCAASRLRLAAPGRSRRTEREARLLVAQPLPQALEQAASKSRRSHSLSLGRQAQLPRALARAVWLALPGVPRWASFDDVGASATVGARLHRPSGGSAVEPCPRGLHQAHRGTRGTLACTVLFVARAPNASASPSARKPYLGKIRRRERESAKVWRRSARAEPIANRGGGAPATCPAEVARHSVRAPRLYTAQGVRAALSSAVCSRACAAARLRGPEANRTRWAGEPPPCLLGGARAGCDPAGGNVLLVVSHWNADVRYLRSQPYCYVVYEKHGNGQEHVLDFSVANKANEASTYLHFISSFYEALPATTLFLQDGRRSAHNPDLVRILRHLRLDAAATSSSGYLPLNSVHVPFLSPSAFCHVQHCVSEVPSMRRLLPSGSLPRHPMDISYTCCAQFLVSRDAVRAHPKRLYEALYAYALGSSDYGHRGDSFARGESLEVLWHVLFGRPRVDAPVPPATLCGEAAAAGCTIRSENTSGANLHGLAPADDPFWSWAAPLWARSSAEDRRSMRAGQLSPMDAAARHGLLRGAPPPSTNCSLLEAQSEALVSRRKLRTTLQHTCTTGATAGANGNTGGAAHTGASMPLHERALCTLYDAPGFVSDHGAARDGRFGGSRARRARRNLQNGG